VPICASIHILFFIATYELARKMEKTAADISTSEDGRFEKLQSNSTEIFKKRLIKKPRFYDELDNNSNVIYFFKVINLVLLILLQIIYIYNITHE